ncbi:spindle assembly abnormal 4 [Megalopta genalis]|uniref:spindle assembly abnormal 4 n=1 Tax=Megalopta genalis TaxID=115081 RepID=UPI003FD64E8B
MDLEANIVERLEKLRQWQVEQQERLFKQQQMQREILTQKQDCIYKALELSLQELDLSGNILHANNSIEIKSTSEADSEDVINYNKSQSIGNSMEMVSENVNNFISREQSSHKDLIDEAITYNDHEKQRMRGNNDKGLMLFSPEQGKKIDQFIIEGIAPLLSKKNCICIDDVPLPSPRKDFHTLLEEKLKDSENVSEEKSSSNSTIKMKKPFLRKGQGLSRFKLNKDSQASSTKPRLHNASSSTCTQSEHSRHLKNEFRNNNTNRSVKAKEVTKYPQKQLCLKNVPLPKKKLRSKSESSTSVAQVEDYINDFKNTAELGTSDFQSKTQKEIEEVRMFELLEEKAENSSFCSTSSTVVAFLQQSTPFKAKRHLMSPIIKNPKCQSVLKANNAFVHVNSMPSCDYKSILSKKELFSKENNNTLYGIKPSEQFKENTKVNTNIKKYIPSKNLIQSTCEQENMYETANVEENDIDISLHVRFSEYNEYKTIGLTDTSSISTESLTVQNFCDGKIWNDSTSLEISDTEISQSSIIMQDKVQTNNYELKFEQCSIQQKLNYDTQIHESIKQGNAINYNEDVHQHNYNDESEFSDTTVQTLDNEQSILEEYKNTSMLQDTNNFRNTQNSENCSDKETIELVDSYNNVAIIEDERNEENLQKSNETIFKSELLKTRLLELEHEINIFRKENAALSVQRNKFQEDHRNLRREYIEKEKKLEETRKQMEDRLQEERKKLVREKTALENRMRDSQEKAQQSKLERREIQNLRQEMETLKEELNLKESRWYAAQSRHKCQMRILKLENSKLKQEIEKLQYLKKSNAKTKGKLGTFSNTKAIHQINKQINMQNKELRKGNDNSSSNEKDQKSLEPITRSTSTIGTQDVESYKNSVMNEKLQKCQTSAINVAKKRNLYETLIKEATLDLTNSQEQYQVARNLNVSKSDLGNESGKLNDSIDAMKNDSEELIKDSDAMLFNYTTNNTSEQFTTPSKMSHKHHNHNTASISSDELSSNTCIKKMPSPCQNNSDIDIQSKFVKQIEHLDGHIEYWYPNGNVKKIFPDQGLTKLLYYNGDVRETSKDGKVKYFYASTRTWHTTMPDGIEILEFADGQIERRLHDGAIEVSFPDGSTRVSESDGSEKVTLLDGTIIQTFTNGDKIFTLPNGQREIHTKTHKRREYPDGTVKFIYSDGTQETRYSNGRIRLKDKDGNLLMDSYQ